MQESCEDRASGSHQRLESAGGILNERTRALGRYWFRVSLLTCSRAQVGCPSPGQGEARRWCAGPFLPLHMFRTGVSLPKHRAGGDVLFHQLCEHFHLPGIILHEERVDALDLRGSLVRIERHQEKRDLPFGRH